MRAARLGARLGVGLGARLGVRGGRAGGRRLLSVAVVAGLGLGADALVVGCSSSGSHGGAKTTGPSMVQARSVATQEFGQLSGGGWSQAWALWSAAAQGAMSEADFVRLNTQCRPALGEPYVIDTATDVDATTVQIAWHQGSATGVGTVVYQRGTWKYQPDARTLAEYRKGVAQLVAERKAEGRCH